METTSVLSPSTFSRLKLFLALSRTPHGLLDMTTPALGALLCLGAFPSLKVVLLGVIAAFGGYTAVYALNDIVDYRIDREKLRKSADKEGSYLDAVFVRHPIAQGFLSLREGIFWMSGWALIALIAAYQLNPVCAFILIAGCVLEIIYCRMLHVTHLRTLVSGVVKTLGGIAAVFAVNPDPGIPFLVVFFLWLYFWEIGGQNIPADWYDLEEDRQLQAKTIPVCYGCRDASTVVLLSLTISVVLSIVLFRIAPADLSFFHVMMGLGAGTYLLLLPAYRLFKTQAHASALFNRASYYPLAMLLIVLVSFTR